jgi:hypothetical protein
MTVQQEADRSATTNPLDERIDPYRGIGWTLRSGMASRSRGGLRKIFVIERLEGPGLFEALQRSRERVDFSMSGGMIDYWN